MTFTYNQSRSEIFELTMLPLLAYDKADNQWEFTNKEKAILAESLDTHDEINQLFEPLRDKVRTYYPMGSGWSFLTVCYFYLLNQGQEVTDIEDLHQRLLALPEEELHTCLRLFLEDKEGQKDYWTILEDTDLAPSAKWHILAYSRNLAENIQQTVALSRELVALYGPYFEKARSERASFAQTVDVEGLLASSQSDFVPDEDRDFGVELFVLSPWMVRMSYIGAKDFFDTYKNFLILSCQIDEVMLSHKDLDEDNFSSTLKSLSDLTRYKVLVELTQPHAKAKDIAEELDITSAAVSFHRQKLVNAQLLLFNSSEKNIKYDANKELIQAVIDKLKEDFDLD